MSLAVDNPILNNPFKEPKEYWIYEKGQPKRMSGRRPAGYYFRTGGGKLFPDLLGNTESFQPAMRIDTKLLGEAESEDGTQTKQEVAQGLRLRVATVGKTEWEGQGEPPGKDMRCVVSVGMLTEGWDANNVTQTPSALVQALKDREKFQWQAREMLFPQVLAIVKRFIHEKVTFIDAKPNEIALEKYIQLIVERLLAAIEPDTGKGETPLLPIIERFRPKGSTSEVLFRTVRKAHPTLKSHVSHMVTDNRSWEHTVAFYLEDNPNVISYVKNDHLDFSIPYDFLGVRHYYYPDFLIRYNANGLETTVILEVKGYESEQDRQKKTAVERWVKAINYHGGFSRWELLECKDPRSIDKILNGLV